MQKHVNLVDLAKSFPTNIFLQNLASIQKRTSPLKFAHLAQKSENGSISNLSTKVMTYRLNATAPWDIDVVEALAGSSRSDTHETLAAQAVVEEMWVPLYSKIEVLASFVFVCVLFDVTRTYGAKGDGSLAMIGEYHLRLIILVVICAKELLEETVQLVDLAQRNYLCFF